jgi:exodeoxyribonuclease V alpha subunit
MSSSSVKTDIESIDGLVDRIVYQNHENGYHILKVKGVDKSITTVTITFPGIHTGINYKFFGNWTEHPKYGKQFIANSIEEIVPNSKEGLKAYLSSSFFKGIGPTIANRIIEKFGDDAIEVFNNNIDKLIEIKGISKPKLKQIKKSWEENIEVNDVMIFLREHGISTTYASKIYKFYGRGCVSRIKKNPYSLAKDIKGIGFRYADKIALEVGLKEDSKERIQACILYVIEKSTENGHCFLYKEQIAEGVKEYLSSSLEGIEKKIDKEIRGIDNIDGIIVFGEDERCYTRIIFFQEKYCAEKITRLSKNTSGELVFDNVLDGYKGVNLSDEQKESVLSTVNKGVSILTGGPGTGKSTVTKAIVHALNRMGKNVKLAAPTGRAAKRMSQVIGKNASTIHKMLGRDPVTGGFMYHENNTMKCDFLIVDESSMIDISLASSLLKALPNTAQVLFIGDVDQLPPVGPGSFFKDLIESGKVPVLRLTKIFRQGNKSLIVEYAHGINKGDKPKIMSPIKHPDIWKKHVDCMFISSGSIEHGKSKEEYPEFSSMRFGKDLKDMIVLMYNDTIKKYKKDINEVQILIPIKIGNFGTESINKVIQETANPKKRGKKEIEVFDKLFREGDKIIQNVNNYDLEVFNGDIGVIKRIDPKEGLVEVSFEGDRNVVYKKNQLKEIQLSYAITIHKSQGSEFESVVIPIIKGYSRMLTRNIIYTALTRAKKLAVFLGHRHVFNYSIDNVDESERQTSLAEML